MRTKSLAPEQMQARVARFDKLQSYQRQNHEAHNIPPGAVEKVTARRVYPVMAPADYQGRSAGAPVKGPRGLIVSIAECEPGNGPGLHRHLNTVENFLCAVRLEILTLVGLQFVEPGDASFHLLGSERFRCHGGSSICIQRMDDNTLSRRGL